MRVLLDTNIWSSLGDEGTSRPFRDFMQSRGLEVLVTPSTLVEVMDLPVPAPRQRIIEALITGSRRRLPTEAMSESAEVVAEIRRARPAWLRAMPDTATVASLNTFWTRTIWRQARETSERLHLWQQAQPPIAPHIVRQQRRQRHDVLETRFSFRPLTAIKARLAPETPDHYRAGWIEGDEVDAWRAELRDLYWHQLVVVPGRAVVTRQDTTFADWVGAYVDLRRLGSSRADFTRFWLYDASAEAVPRNWIRWAVRHIQTTQKISGGNPADEQHSSYLVDADIFLSADSRYVSTLKIVRDDAPFAMAEPRLVSGDRCVPILDRLAAVL
ncbi:hypothetical protein AB0B39_27635 [Micromonospora sp. NPDC049114]|uniref:DUF4935 domain-containing protein n=1 Tax=Micromonospora parastrephiae TaxID=2806101 RepID=A0ABS1XT88_9ACTN|nr:hypothetical protein [Micromonospora parastrephiae]MBM0232484.1 hypothetical protein [Micromonospora parastrephiae]